MIAQLLRELPTNIAVPPDLVEKGRVLDEYSTSAGDPKLPPDGSFSEPIDHTQSEQAIHYAGEILGFTVHHMTGSENI